MGGRGQRPVFSGNGRGPIGGPRAPPYPPPQARQRAQPSRSGRGPIGRGPIGASISCRSAELPWALEELEQECGSLEEAFQRYASGSEGNILVRDDLEHRLGSGFKDRDWHDLLGYLKAVSDRGITVAEWCGRLRDGSRPETLQATVKGTRGIGAFNTQVELDGTALTKVSCSYQCCDLRMRLFSTPGRTEAMMELEGEFKRNYVPLDMAKGSVSTNCPVCMLMLTFTFKGGGVKRRREEPEYDERNQRRRKGGGGKGRKGNENPESAFVTFLWKDDRDDGTVLTQFIMDALVLGSSLRKHGTQHKLVLMATKEALEFDAMQILNLFWEVRCIDSIEVNRKLVSRCKEKFSLTFTKLRAWELDEFKKVVLMDTDMLVRRNVDELLFLPAPSAWMRGHQLQAPGCKRRPESFFNKKSGEQAYGINAGVIVLQPDRQQFADMTSHLGQTDPKTFRASAGPEQDFLTSWFLNEWQESLHLKYNYQLHQLMNIRDNQIDRLLIPQDDINIYHYSTEHKPSTWYSDRWVGKDFGEFVRSFMKDGNHDDVVRQRIYDAFQEWNSAARDTFERCLEKIVYMGDRQEWCPLCGHAMQSEIYADFAHVFFECPQIAPLAEDWREELGLRMASSDHLWGACKPGYLMPSLRFIGNVFAKKREGNHVQWVSGNPADALVPIGASSAMRGREKGKGKGKSKAGKSCTDISVYDARVAHANAAPSLEQRLSLIKSNIAGMSSSRTTPMVGVAVPDIIQSLPPDYQPQLQAFFVKEEIFDSATLADFDDESISMLLKNGKEKLSTGAFHLLKKRIAEFRASLQLSDFSNAAVGGLGGTMHGASPEDPYGDYDHQASMPTRDGPPPPQFRGDGPPPPLSLKGRRRLPPPQQALTDRGVRMTLPAPRIRMHTPESDWGLDDPAAGIEGDSVAAGGYGEPEAWAPPPRPLIKGPGKGGPPPQAALADATSDVPFHDSWGSWK